MPSPRPAGHDQGRRAAGRQQRPEARVRARRIDDHECRREEAEPEPADRRREPARELAPARQRSGQQPAKRELPDAARQRVERPRLDDVGQPHGEREARRPAAPTIRIPTLSRDRSDPRADDQQRRPDQVELLLDPERPEVAERRRRRSRRSSRSTRTANRMLPIDSADAAPSWAIPGTCSGARTTAASDHRDGHGRQRGRQDPAHPPRVEATRGRSGRSGSCSRSSRPVIRKPDMTKKTSTPMNPPRRHRQADVEPQDGENGDPPEALDVRQEAR